MPGFWEEIWLACVRAAQSVGAATVPSTLQNSPQTHSLLSTMAVPYPTGKIWDPAFAVAMLNFIGTKGVLSTFLSRAL